MPIITSARSKTYTKMSVMAAWWTKSHQNCHENLGILEALIGHFPFVCNVFRGGSRKFCLFVVAFFLGGGGGVF